MPPGNSTEPNGKRGSDDRVRACVMDGSARPYHPMTLRAIHMAPSGIYTTHSAQPLTFGAPMLYQIASFLLDLLGGLLAGACLLRLYLRWQGAGPAKPVRGLVFALTDWLVIPLRRVMVPVGRGDDATLVPALLLQLVQYFLLALMW